MIWLNTPEASAVKCARLYHETTYIKNMQNTTTSYVRVWFKADYEETGMELVEAGTEKDEISKVSCKLGSFAI